MRIRPDKQDRMNRMADIVSRGRTVAEAGEQMGLTKGEASRTWNNIKAGLGAQAR